MPDTDLVLNVKQIAGYPNLGVQASDTILLQRGGLGGPYLSAMAEQVVSTALLGNTLPLQVGYAAPAGANPAQLFTNEICTPIDGTWLWNGYVDSAGAIRAAAPGPVAVVNVDVTNGWQYVWSNAVQPGQPWDPVTAVSISPTGYINGGEQILLARDPAGPMEAATAQWVDGVVAGLRAETVWSFEGRRGDVRLWIQDILRAGGAPIFSPMFMGSPMAFTPSLRSNSNRLATTAFAHMAAQNAVNCLLQSQPLVFSFNGRSGDVVLSAADVEAAGATFNFAPLDSPNFSGQPTAPTAPPGTQDGQLATTAFVMNAVQESTTGVASFNGRTGTVALSAADVTGAGGAPIVSPVFSGTPQAPTAAPGTDTAQLATCAWVINELGGVTSGVQTFNGRAGAVVLTLADVTGVGGAPLASPAFNGVPTAPTAATNTSTQQLATTAFVMNAVTGGSVVSFNGRTGAVTLLANDISAASGVVNPNPSLTGVPTAPLAAPGTSTNQLATCAFVAAALAAAPGVTSFNTRTGVVTLSTADVLAVLPAGTALPLVDGTASAGTATTWSRSDHVHPTDTSRYSASNPSGFQTASQVSAALASYLPLAGGTVSGPTTFNAATTFNVAMTASAGIGMGGNVFYGPNGMSWLGATQIAFTYNGSATIAYITPTIGGSAAALSPLVRTTAQSGYYYTPQIAVATSAVNMTAWTDGASVFTWSVAQQSDRRLKSGVSVSAKDALGALRRLGVYEFDVTMPEGAVPPTQHWRWGLMADEVKPEVPNACYDSGGYAYLAELPLVAALVRAVQQLADRLDALEMRMAT